MKNRYITFKTMILFAFGSLALSPLAQAVVPPPDGGYPGGNTAEGINALHDVNTAVGLNNTAVGANALTHDTTGNSNVAVGSGALESNTTGNFNMAIGTEALRDNNANFNLAIGFRTLFMNTTGNHLTGIGAAALRNNTTASDNTAIGADAMRENTIGEQNTAIGADALSNNDQGNNNTATGFQALINNTGGIFNTATGVQALFTNTGDANGGSATGSANTATGYQALFSNTTGDSNTAVGVNALRYNTSGNNNVALGTQAGFAQTTGSDNIYIGFQIAGTAGESNACYIGNIFDRTTDNLGVPVYINVNNKLGTLASSKRFKEGIKPMDKASDALFALKPVTFRYKKEIDPAGKSQFGLVAEEVEKVNPDLIVRDKEGKPYTVRYDAVNAMLLNEFLKEHKKVEKLEATLEAVNARLQEQAVQIQKVSAQVDAAQPLPHLVLNNP